MTKIDNKTIENIVSAKVRSFVADVLYVTFAHFTVDAVFLTLTKIKILRDGKIMFDNSYHPHGT